VSVVCSENVLHIRLCNHIEKARSVSENMWTLTHNMTRNCWGSGCYQEPKHKVPVECTCMIDNTWLDSLLSV